MNFVFRLESFPKILPYVYANNKIKKIWKLKQIWPRAFQVGNAPISHPLWLFPHVIEMCCAACYVHAYRPSRPWSRDSLCPCCLDPDPYPASNHAHWPPLCFSQVASCLWVLFHVVFSARQALFSVPLDTVLPAFRYSHPSKVKVLR